MFIKYLSVTLFFALYECASVYTLHTHTHSYTQSKQTNTCTYTYTHTHTHSYRLNNTGIPVIRLHKPRLTVHRVRSCDPSKAPSGGRILSRNCPRIRNTWPDIRSGMSGHCWHRPDRSYWDSYRVNLVRYRNNSSYTLRMSVVIRLGLPISTERNLSLCIIR